MVTSAASRPALAPQKARRAVFFLFSVREICSALGIYVNRFLTNKFFSLIRAQCARLNFVNLVRSTNDLSFSVIKRKFIRSLVFRKRGHIHMQHAVCLYEHNSPTIQISFLPYLFSGCKRSGYKRRKLQFFSNVCYLTTRAWVSG